MKPYPRIRKCVKWGGTVVCALLAATWLWSGWWCFEWETPGYGGIFIQAGRFCVLEPVFAGMPDEFGYAFIAPLDVPWEWWPRFGRWNRGRDIAIPLWMIAVPFAACSGHLWLVDIRTRRRALAGACPKCHYDRAGLAPGAVCPECGAAEKPAADQRG